MNDPQELVYEEFDNYDWNSFKEFQDGLSEILECHLEKLKEADPSVDKIPAVEKQQLIDQAKSFFFCSHTGHILNLDDYYTWKRQKSNKAIESTETPENLEEAPYSNNYQQIVDMIVSGKPVPGIKQIPETVLTEQSSKPLAPIRSKPWETKDKSETTEQ